MSDVSLKEHIEMRLSALEDAIAKAEAQMDKRLAAMNEIREAMRDQQTTSVNRNEYAFAHKYLEDKIASLELSRAELKGDAAKTSLLVSVIVSIGVGIVTSIITHYLTGRP